MRTIDLTEAGTNKKTTISVSDISGFVGYDDIINTTFAEKAPEDTKSLVCTKDGIYYVNEDSNEIYNEIKGVA